MTDPANPAAAFLPPEDAAILEAITARLIPTDENGPGAREARVVSYIDRALATDYRAHAAAYAAGLAALEALANSTYARGFTSLGPAEQDAVLEIVERGDATNAFFELVRQHTLEGMFGDPAWGGNAGRIGWDLLGYPGPQLVWTAEDQRLGIASD